ncbi:MAG: S8 family serine peptidase, partial [Clostridiaceae bacterium]|nr:S8 family serine peptidase [Clostridiaceae bacterium]
STVPNNSYESMPGTSMASPMAAGVASLIYGAHPEYTASQVKAILMEETDTFTTDGVNIIPVVNAALSSDYAKTGDIPQVPPGEVIPDPSKTPYPGLPTPRPPGLVEIQLPDHTPFKLEAGQGGLAGLVYDQETENPIDLFTIYFIGPDGTMVDHEFAYPYPATYDAQKMGEFFTRIPVEQGQKAEITNLVIDAPGYNFYEVPTVTVRGGEVTSLIIYLEPEAISESEPAPITDPQPIKANPSDDMINIPGHTPFTPEEGRGGFAGFVYDAETKQPLSSFRIENLVWLTGSLGGTYEFDWPYPDDFLAKLEGEFIAWAKMTDDNPITDTMQGFDITADGYETYHVPDFPVEERAVTDLGVIYLKRIAEEEPKPITDPKPVKPDPGDDAVRLPGHTPFYPEAGYGGFAGFVYDAVTKKPIPSFRLENLIWLDDTPADYEDTYFDWPYPSDMLAEIEGEFMYWLDMLGAQTDTMQGFDIAADGYEIYHVPDFPVEDQAVTDLGVIYLTPKDTSQTSPEGQISVVLDWGSKPADLDLHATAPLTEGYKKFHIFAFDTYMSFGKANDPDAMMTSQSESANGTERIEIFKPQPGVSYTFYVHDFSNTAKQIDSWDLANSEAEVKIYIGDSLVSTLKVPNKEGTLWKVCTIKDGKVTPSETMSYEGRPLNIGASE